MNTSTTLSVGYSYDTAAHGSRLIGVTYPDNSSVSYSYGATNSLNYMISRLSTMATGGSASESYEYLGLSTVVIRTRGDGSSLTFLKQGGEGNGEAGDKYAGLDRFGRIVDQRWLANGGGSLDRYQYDYDENSNVTVKVNVLNTDFNEFYAYNNLNQLTGVDRVGDDAYDQSWDLDPLGNMNTATTGSVVVNRTHNSDNQITNFSVTDTQSTTSGAVGYDDNGNVTADQNRTLVWDAWNRLVAIIDADNFLVKSYTYDGMGRRTSETDGYSVKDFYYNTSWQLLEEKVGVTVAANYLWSPVYVDALMYRSSAADGNFYAATDANFNVTVIYAAGENAAERFVFSAYGKRTDLDGSFDPSADTKNLAVGWQGSLRDAVTGYILERNRWYSYDIRWLSGDPAGYVDGANLYKPMSNNPINRRDPSGLAVVVPSPGDFKITTMMIRGNHGYEVEFLPNATFTLPAGHRLVLVQALQYGGNWNMAGIAAHIDDDKGVGAAVNKATFSGINPTAYTDLGGMKGGSAYSFRDAPIYAPAPNTYLSVVAIDRDDGNNWKKATIACRTRDKLIGAINFSFDQTSGDVVHFETTIPGKGGSAVFGAEETNDVWTKAKKLWDSQRKQTP